MKKTQWFGLITLILFNLVEGRVAWGAPVSLTLLHTNDLHSHFRAENSDLELGGIARLKTAIDRARAQAGNPTLLLDGGDWSEGNIYYTEGAGRETLRMMDHLGYDVAVVGNHDWLNGPDVLLDAADTAGAKLSLVAANVDLSSYAQADRFRRRVPPYVIRQVNGARIAFIGLVTYEFIYDKFFKPVAITEPYQLTRALAARLKAQVDAVVVISHNTISNNVKLLKEAPDVDLVIGAHDHVKLTHPVIVVRKGRPAAWVVEAGCWGRYLGQVKLRITPKAERAMNTAGVELLDYHLTQMGRNVPEDAETLVRLAELETVIETHRGPLFHEAVGETEIELERGGLENPMGDFVADAYRDATGADAGMDQNNFVYGALHRGKIRAVDIFNANPGIFNPATGKAWTLKIVPIQGRVLSAILNLLFTSRKFMGGDAINVSGLAVDVNPLFQVGKQSPPGPFPELLPTGTAEAEGLTPVQSIRIGGQPLERARTYRIAMGGGVVEALEFLDSIVPGAVPLGGMTDTGVEDWRIMASYLARTSPFTADKLSYGGRLRTVHSDLGLISDDIQWTPTRRAPGGMIASVQVHVRNLGASPSPAVNASVRVVINRNGADMTLDPEYLVAGAPIQLPALAPGETKVLSWDDVLVPEAEGFYGITAQLLGVESELNHSNDSATRWFRSSDALRAVGR